MPPTLRHPFNSHPSFLGFYFRRSTTHYLSQCIYISNHHNSALAHLPSMIESTHAMSLGSFQIVFLLFFGIAIVLYLTYLSLRPKPIPGVPYNAAGANSIAGDLPSMLAYTSAGGEFFPWLSSQTEKLGSPIVQVFLRPFSKPWIVLSDFREAQDILQRRTKEFDRSDFPSEVFSPIMPEFHMPMKSSDDRLKANKFLMRDLMTPGFLNQVGHFNQS